jgi:hypothetical protein
MAEQARPGDIIISCRSCERLLLGDIEAGQGSFLIIERTADAGGQTYAQVARNDDGTYLVEHREGSADHHYQTTAPTMREAHALLTGWAFELDGWRDHRDRSESLNAFPVRGSRGLTLTVRQGCSLVA